VSAHVGTVGRREVFAGLRLSRVLHFASEQLGTVHLHLFEDAAGNELVWKTSAICLEPPGKTFTVKATVKAHDEYRGTPRTVLARVVEWPRPPKMPAAD
jgi:hypothetical protein